MFQLKTSLLIMMFLPVLTLTPAFAEITSFELDKTFYSKGDQIIFSGTVEEKDNGLVSIVIRDSNGEFVLLTQAFIQPDNTFERSLDTDEKFGDHGIHNATAFILDLAKGQTISFDFSQDGTLPNPSITFTLIPESDPIEEKTDTIPQTNNESVSENEPTLASFVDSAKDPQHYLDRYYNEPAYKEWFDNNYPELTIEEVVGATSPIMDPIEENLENVISDKVMPKAEASQTVSTPLSGNNSDTNDAALLVLALSGLGILLGAIYGIKRKVDTNSENISKNHESIKKKMFGMLHWNKPEDVIKNRLAHGEISVKEYSTLKRALKK